MKELLQAIETGQGLRERAYPKQRMNIRVFVDDYAFLRQFPGYQKVLREAVHRVRIQMQKEAEEIANNPDHPECGRYMELLRRHSDAE